ncbi:MAG: hypothetical protein R3C01_07450 [Planctomycetaceae bacterium]
MVKKMGLGALAVVAVGSFLFGRDTISYLTTGADSVREAVRGEVPIAFEIERARTEVANLVPEIRKSMHVIATQEVDVRNLQAAITRQEAKLAEQEEAILAINEELKSGDTKFVIDRRTFSQKDLEKDLAARFNRFKIAQDALEQDRQSLTAKSEALASMKDTLEEMLSARKGLEVEIDRLVARLRSVEAAESIASLQVDESQLARARTIIAEISKELDVRQQMVDAEGNFTGVIPIEKELKEAPADISEQVASYFSKGTKETVTPETTLVSSHE